MPFEDLYAYSIEKIHLYLFKQDFAFELADFIKSPRSPRCALRKNLTADFLNLNLNHYKSRGHPIDLYFFIRNIS